MKILGWIGIALGAIATVLGLSKRAEARGAAKHSKQTEAEGLKNQVKTAKVRAKTAKKKTGNIRTSGRKKYSRRKKK